VLEGLNELVGLSRLDSKIAALEEELGALPARRAAAAEQQAAGEARLAVARERVSEAEQDQRRCEGQAQDKEALLAKLESQQHQVKTNVAYTALLSEIDQAREAISEAETGLFAQAILRLRVSLSRSNSWAEPSCFRTWMGRASTYSYVVKRPAHSRHSRRRRTAPWRLPDHPGGRSLSDALEAD